MSVTIYSHHYTYEITNKKVAFAISVYVRVVAIPMMIHTPPENADVSPRDVELVSGGVFSTPTNRQTVLRGLESGGDLVTSPSQPTE